uniref:RNA-guided endonuclease InsQ/TnpB family protein n=1 Tax=Companilactobacillus sp. HBUAS59699 TaxID=3109358 RepID=UPI002FF3F8FF
VSKLQKSVMNQRSNFLNNLSTTLIKNHDLVATEDLSSKNMLKNHALAMSISDVGWRTFLQQLEYKAELYGKTFVKINPYNTTQTCSDCGYWMRDEEHLTLNDREWTCPNCNTFHIRDHNAAKNILAKGLKEIA